MSWQARLANALTGSPAWPGQPRESSDDGKLSGNSARNGWSTSISLQSRGLSPVAWLVYVGFWVIQPVYEHKTRTWIYLALALLAFVSFFFGALYGNLRTRRLCTLGILVLALLYVPVNQSSFGIYFYLPWFLISLVESDAAFFRLIGLECTIIVLQAWVFHLESWEWSVAIGVCALSGLNAVRMRQQGRANAKLRMARDEIEQLAKTAERERIARDLHDVLGHTLSLIAVKSELAGRLLATDPARAAQELAEIETTARRALTEVRQTVSGYRAQGLEAEIQQAAAALAAAGVTVTSRPQRAPRLPAQQEASLALILREAVTNIVRHAGARSCAISLETGPQGTVLVVHDDGCGITGEEGNGLRGMRERVRELGGELQLRSDGGAVVQVVLPRVQRPAPGEPELAGAVLSPVAP